MDYEEDGPYADGTFKTGLNYSTPDLASDNDVKLPNVVNFVALRETFLSEAPFVSRNNRSFWKKWIDSKQYINVLAATLFVASDCIGENGGLDLEKLYTIKNNVTIEKMSINIAEMMVMNKSRYSNSHDTLFRRLPELLCYMVVNALQSSNPRHARVYNSSRFRVILLDWIGELIGGLRLTDCRKDREWLFSDATDYTITINRPPPVRYPTQLRSLKRNKELGGTAVLASRSQSVEHLSTAISHFSIENSPLINLYMNLGKSKKEPKHVCPNAISINMTHVPGRPLMNLKEECMEVEGAFRERKFVDGQLAKTLKQSKVLRSKLLAEHEYQRKLMMQDIQKIRESYRIQLSILNNKQVSNKQILAAATGLEIVKNSMAFGEEHNT